MAQIDVGKALRNTSPGRLKYDKSWGKDGRTEEVLNEISKFSKNVAIHIISKELIQVVNAIKHETLNDQEKKELKNEECNKNSSLLKQNPKEVNNRCHDSDTYLYELQKETQLPISEFEEERLKSLQYVFKVKKEEFEKFTRNLGQQTQQQYYLLKKNNELNEKRRIADLKKIEDDSIKEAKEKEFLQKQHDQNQAKKLSAIVQEAELKRKKEEEERINREQEQQEFSLQLSNCKLKAENLIFETKQKLKCFEHPEYLKISADDRISQMGKFLDGINLIVKNSKSESLKYEDISHAYSLCRKAYDFFQDLTNDIELAKATALCNHEKQLLESKKIHKVASASSETVAAKNSISEVKESSEHQSTEKKETSKSKINNEYKAILCAFIAPDVVEEYHGVMESLKSIKKIDQSFIDDPKNKKLRFELQKSINVPINAISSISGAHVRDKISRLLSILGNKASNKEISKESLVYNFCANLIARKFVEQGDTQISAQHSTAFPIAMAIVGVWIKKPEIGTLILGHFYSNCPYLVPFYPQRMENQSEKEYFESLGYSFDKEDNIEPEYKFLNRISGYMRLYAAILVSPVPPAPVKHSHPFGISHGWQWLSRILNMDPRPDITATLLYNFLDVTGHTLQKIYGKQFKKLLHIICKDFFPKIKRITPSGSGGPVQRLETFLQGAIKKGYIPPPEGILDAGFWKQIIEILFL